MIKYFRIGKIISLHGINGEVKVFPTTDDNKRFEKLNFFYLDNNPEAENIVEQSKYFIEKIKYLKNQIIIKIKNFDSIEDSTCLIGKSLYINRKEAIKLNSNEFYVADLIGINAIFNKEKIGYISDVLNSKAGSIFAIKYKSKIILIPFNEEFIFKINLVYNEIIFKNIESFLKIYEV